MEHFRRFPTVQYDIALKTLLESSRESFFREILHEEIQRVESIEELPTETVSVHSTDFPVRVIDGSGKELIHLIEFQSDWDEEKLLSLIHAQLRIPSPIFNFQFSILPLPGAGGQAADLRLRG